MILESYRSALAAAFALSFAGFAHADWKKSATLGTGSATAVDVRSVASDGTNLYAGTFGSGVFWSADGGAAWTAGSGHTVLKIGAVGMFGSEVLTGTDGAGLYTSINGAKTSTVTKFSNGSITSIRSVGNTIYISSKGGLYSLAGDTKIGSQLIGLSTEMPCATVSAFVVSGQFVVAGSCGGIVISKDGGATWKSSSVGLVKTNVTSLAQMGNALIAGTYDGGIYRSTDEGANWIPVTQGLTGPISVLYLLPIGSSLLAAIEGGVYQSNDAGVTWSNVSTGAAGKKFSSLAVHGNTLVAGTIGAGVYTRPLSELAITVGLRAQSGLQDLVFGREEGRFSITASAGIPSVRVLDALGRFSTYPVKTGPSAGYSVDLSGLPKGMYLVQIRSGSHELREKVLVR